MQKHRKVAEKATEPYVKKSKELYDAHVRRHVEKAIVKGHHLAPVVSKTGEKMEEISAQSRRACDDVFKALVAQFRTICPPKYGMCQNPEKTVTFLLQVLAVLLAILFRRVIWRLLSGGVRLIIGILWFFSPLRLFLSLYRSKQSKPAEKQKATRQSTKSANGKKRG